MKCCFFLIVLSILLLGSTPGYGQSGQHIYEDSSIMYPEDEQNTEVIEAPVAEEESSDAYSEKEETEEDDYIDTAFTANELVLSPDSIQRLKNRKDFAYAKKLDSLLRDYQQKQLAKFKKSSVDTGPSIIELFFKSRITEFFFWSLAIAFIAFIVYRLFISGGFFQRQSAKIKNIDPADDDEHLSKDKSYDPLIANAVKAQNYRLATRYLYLQLLQKLNRAGAIEFAADKTNTDYLREISGKPYKAEAAALTLHYEYVWYGEFAVDFNTYSKLETRFKNLPV